jgi:uncharacterized protein YbbC (DUF1343 family)
MTPGETAVWIRQALRLKTDLKIATMQNYHRESARRPDWPPWTPPSPGIRSWESAICYTATVFCEALPAIDHGRGTGLPFQIIGAPWLKSLPVCERLCARHLPGVDFHPHIYQPSSKTPPHPMVEGIRIVVTNPGAFRPVLTGVSILHVLQKMYGCRRIWKAPGTRPEFFDKLMGTSSVREALLYRESPCSLDSRWRREWRTFNKTRSSALLYSPD